MSAIDTLKGKTILVGKEPVNGRLLVSVKINGQPKSAYIGNVNSVPNTVSRCLANEDVAHCKLQVDNSGTITVTNLKAANVTYVNGTEIVSKKVTTDSTLELGQDRFPISVGKIVEAASKLVEAVFPPPPEEYSIKHLQDVWEEYNENLKTIQIRQRNVGLLSRIPMALSMLGGIFAGVASEEIKPFAYTFTVIAFLIFLFGLYKSYTDKSIEEKEAITEEFQRKYVCPKEGCHHFMGNQPYHLLRQNKKCPYCGSLLNEK